MKKFVPILLLLFCVAAQAQQHEQCGTDEIHRNLLATNPVYARRVHEFDTYSAQQRMRDANQVYRIPVVVHIMHKGEATGTGTNLSDGAVKAAIKNLNEKYRKVPGSTGDGNGVDTGIEFALAVRGPDGKCTTGINRIDMSQYPSYMGNGVYYNTAGMPAAQLKALSMWDQDSYYNIWLVSGFDGGNSPILGYASYPNVSENDGAIIKASEFTDPLAKTNAHEIGHALYLYHTFEGDGNGDNCPQANGCGSGLGDCCEDTPPHKRSLANCFAVTGPNPCNNNSTDDSFVKNYMSSAGAVCANIFTANQRERMRAAVTFSRAGLLQENGNLSLVPPTAPAADFEILSGQVICAAGELVKLVDKTSCIPNTFLQDSSWPDVSFLWIITNGTDVYNYTDQNPVFTLSNPGTYTVKLNVTTGFGTTTITKSNAFVVTGPAIAGCTPTSNYIIFGMIENVTFNTINKSTTQTGPYSNFTCTENTMLQAGSSYTLSITMNANHGNFNGTYEAFIDYNNNGIFENDELVTSGGSVHSEAVVHTEIVTIPHNAVQNTMLTMRVAGAINGITNEQRNCAAAYNFGDIEDYGIYISSTLNTEMPVATGVITLSPNPATTAFTLTANNSINNVKLYNMLGQMVLQKELNATQSTIDISGLSAGAYMVNATAQGKTLALKLIKN